MPGPIDKAIRLAESGIGNPPDDPTGLPGAAPTRHPQETRAPRYALLQGLFADRRADAMRAAWRPNRRRPGLPGAGSVPRQRPRGATRRSPNPSWRRLAWGGPCRPVEDLQVVLPDGFSPISKTGTRFPFGRSRLRSSTVWTVFRPASRTGRSRRPGASPDSRPAGIRRGTKAGFPRISGSRR